MRSLKQSGGVETHFASAARLGRHLPLLGGLLGVPTLSAAAISFANHVTREVFPTGDATALVAAQLRALTVVWIKLAVALEQAATFVGL